MALLLGGKEEQYSPHYWFYDRYLFVQGEAMKKRLHLVLRIKQHNPSSTLLYIHLHTSATMNARRINVRAWS